MLLAISILASLPIVSWGQCPDPSTPDPGPPWTGPHTTSIILGNGCNVTVTYCDRVNDGGSEYEMYIESVQPTDPLDPPCNSLTPTQTITQAYIYFQQFGDPTDVYVPPCSSGETQTLHEYLEGCWRMEYVSGNPIYYPCDPNYFGTICEYTCSVCDDNGTIIFTGCSMTSVGTNSCHVPADTWVPNTCYSLNLCGPN